jgi:hypothetical protein
LNDAWSIPGFTVQNENWASTGPGTPDYSELPSDVTTVTVTGYYLDNEGKPASGRFIFDPSVSKLVHPVSGAVIRLRRETVDLVAGRFSTRFIATDNTSLSPLNFTYRVVGIVAGQTQKPFSMALPAAVPNVTMASLLKVPSSMGTINMPPAPKGDKGDTGATGPKGDQGDVGPQGIAGAASTVAGPQGPQGDTGPQGLQGAQGAKGDTGNQGPQGTQGTVGPKGDQGIQGEPGPQGLQGLQGPQGDIGATGPQGLQGVAGPQGPQGDAGPQGLQGLKGDTGATGSTGPQGAQGAPGADSTVPGPQGPKGDTGAQGDIGPQGTTGATGLQGNPTTVNGKSGASITLTAADVSALDLTSAGFAIPADHGLATWTQDPATCNPTGVTLSSGALALSKVFLRSTKTVSAFWYAVTNVGAGLSGTYVGLYTSAGVLIDQSTDQSSSMTSTGVKTAAMGVSHTLAPGAYWVAFLVSSGTTMPTVARGSNAVTGVTNVNLTAANYRFGAYGSALAALPGSITVASITNVANGTVWAGLS